MIELIALKLTLSFSLKEHYTRVIYEHTHNVLKMEAIDDVSDKFYFLHPMTTHHITSSLLTLCGVYSNDHD